MSDDHALYRFYASDGALLYIGITLNPGARWPKHRDNKPWWSEVAEVRLESHPSRQAVLDAERAAIIDERPRYNVVHNTGNVSRDEQNPQPVLDRLLPFQAGDWVALGLRDGRCPVGGIVAVTDQWITVRLKSFLDGGLTDRVVAVRWEDVEQAELALREHAQESEWEGFVMQDEHLGEFQTAWVRWKCGPDGRAPLDTVRREVRMEMAR